jgi:hypothetical protein
MCFSSSSRDTHRQTFLLLFKCAINDSKLVECVVQRKTYETLCKSLDCSKFEQFASEKHRLASNKNSFHLVQQCVQVHLHPCTSTFSPVSLAILLTKGVTCGGYLLGTLIFPKHVSQVYVSIASFQF